MSEDESIERNNVITLCSEYAYRFPWLTPLHPDISLEGVRALPL